MALSRLIFSHAELHLPNTGLSKPRRWFTAPLPSSTEKKVSKRSEAIKEKRTKAVKSFLQSYMEKHPGRFPKIKEVQNAIGGSWYLLKDILLDIRNKMLPELETNQNTEFKQSTAEISSLPKETSNNNDSDDRCETNVTNTIEEKFPKLDKIETKTEQIKPSIDVKFLKLDEIETKTEQIKPSIEQKYPKLDKTETKTEQIIPLIEEKRPKLNLNSCISSILGNRNNLDTKNNEYLSGAHTKTPGILSLAQGLKNGPKCKNEIKNGSKCKRAKMKFGSLKDDLLQEREANTEGKHVDNFFSAIKGLGKNNGDLNSNLNLNLQTSKFRERNRDNGKNNGDLNSNLNLQTSKFRERKRDNGKTNGDLNSNLNLNLQTSRFRERNRDHSGIKSILSVLADKDTTGTGTQNQTLNFGNFRDSFSAQNPNPKGGGLIDLLNKWGENEKNTDDSDISNSESEEGPICEENEKCKYGLFVRFLDKNISISDIYGSLGGLCGPIESVQFLPSQKNDPFNCATVFFKTEKGLKTALQITDPVICKTDVFLEPMVTSAVKMDAELALQDPDFPVNILKCPSRSVVVKELTESISFDQLRFSLGPFGPISDLAMGRSASSVYVEFESEESKEKALEAARIKVLGKNLNIYRVYMHKTNVVRISNVNNETMYNKIQSICGAHGKVKRVVQRYGTIFDVHFRHSELPNILTILNRLNGMVVDKNKWMVQPSTFLNVGIIQNMWNSEEGRKKVHEIFQNMCTKIIDKNAANISPLIRLLQDYTKNN